GPFPLIWIPWPSEFSANKGHARADITFQGLLSGPVSAEGKIVAQDMALLLDCPGRRKAFSLSKTILDFKSTCSTSHLNISSMTLKNKDFSLAVNGSLDFRDPANPFISLKVESPFMPLETLKEITPMPLLPSWIRTRLVPIITTGNVRVDHFSLKGSVDQINDLDLPANAGALSIGLSWQDLAVLKEGAGLPFKGVSGKLLIHNGALRISEVKGRFEQSTVRDATLHVRNLFNGPLQYDVSINGLFDIQDLLRQREVDLIPDHVREKLQRLEFASGALDGHIQVRYQTGWDRGRVVKGEFLLKNCSVAQKELLYPLDLSEASIALDDQGRIQFQGTGFWGNSVFKAEGSFNKSLDKGTAFFTGKADFNEIMGLLGPSQKPFARFTSRANCRLTLTRSHDLWSWNGEMDLEGLHMETRSFSMDPPGKKDKILFNLALHARRGLELKSLTGMFGNSACEVSGAFSLKGGKPFNIQVFTSDFSLRDLGLRFKGAEATAKGRLTARARVRGFWRDPSRLTVAGDMEGHDLSMALPQSMSPISNCHFKVTSTGKEISLSNLRMRVGQSPLRIQGHLQGWDGLKGRLAVHADYLDLSDFIGGVQPRLSGPRNGTSHGKGPLPVDGMTESVSNDPNPCRFIKRSHVQMTVKGLKGHWKELRYGPFRAECAFRSGDFHVKGARFHMEHGMLGVKGHMKYGARPEKVVSTVIKLRKQPVKDTLVSLGLGQEYLDGLLTAQGSLSMKGVEWHELIPSLTGNMDILLEKGKIKQSSVILKVLDFLSLQKIFMKKPPDLSKEGFYYETIMAPVSCDKGVMEIQNLVMKSPVFNAVALGKVDLKKEWVDVDLGAQPLGTIDFLVSSIPVLGYILTGDEKSILIYTFKVNGPLSGPKVRYAPIKNLGGGIVGVFKRLFLTPGRLLKKMSAFSKAFPAGDAPLFEEDLEIP
ncbi:MAG: hypothetical protein GY849_18225, partial [Deltaproteobacteria bacterium]|nr:hypothetical protein [Deltaproteobacteria bacterium]